MAWSLLHLHPARLPSSNGKPHDTRSDLLTLMSMRTFEWMPKGSAAVDNMHRKPRSVSVLPTRLLGNRIPQESCNFWATSSDIRGV